MRTFLALSLPLCFFFVAVSASPEDLAVFKTGLQSLSRAVNNYESDFNNNLKFRDLQSAIDVVDTQLLGFLGTAKRHLDNVRNLNSNAYLTYGRATGAALEWCVSYNSTVNLFTGNINEPITDSDKQMLWKMVLATVSQGLVKIGDSFKVLKDVKQRRNELHQNLEEMHRSFNFDLGPRGFYEMRTQDLIRKDDTLNRRLVAEIDIRFRQNEVGPHFVSETADCLNSTFDRVSAHRKNELSQVLAGLRPIEGSIEKAAKLANIPEFDVEEDRTKIDALKTRMSQEELKQKVILENDWDSQVKLVPLLQSLGADCKKYEMKKKA
ncbi:uncharacterized protein [Drosophila bipectinata]|uniref:uncharacterized protein n=1 Tax=Drosophila bipectinata TaxID=42026 RepID=UPI001C8A628F|nr:uncharacterized protein LOC108134351 [Drosophila bipectinata]